MDYQKPWGILENWLYCYLDDLRSVKRVPRGFIFMSKVKELD